jgi:hypothetical protein
MKHGIQGCYDNRCHSGYDPSFIMNHVHTNSQPADITGGNPRITAFNTTADTRKSEGISSVFLFPFCSSRGTTGSD